MENKIDHDKMTLEKATRITVLQGRKPLKTLAQTLDYNFNTLKRALKTKSKYGINIRHLQQLFDIQKEYTLLEF